MRVQVRVALIFLATCAVVEVEPMGATEPLDMRVERRLTYEIVENDDRCWCWWREPGANA